mmetsp:Transcript_61643/g.144537  ORF Transcript_61643/g.144537 Transcript_61643/m.144537 type:complete len:261 (-) Transcript_61643:964-1746(-)
MLLMRSPGSARSAFRGTYLRIKSTAFLASISWSIRRRICWGFAEGLISKLYAADPSWPSTRSFTTPLTHAPQLMSQYEIWSPTEYPTLALGSGSNKKKWAATFSRYLCQKLITTEVQMGAVSQHRLTASSVWVGSVRSAISAEDKTALAAVVALQLAWFFRMSARTRAIRSTRSAPRSSSGLCQISTGSWGSKLQTSPPFSTSPMSISCRLRRSTRMTLSHSHNPDSRLVLSKVGIRHNANTCSGHKLAKAAASADVDRI